MERFADLISPYLTNCPAVLIKAEVLKAAIKFCGDTWIWQQDAVKTVAAGEADISFTIPTDARMIGAQLSQDGYGINTYTKGVDKITLNDAVSQSTTFQTTVFLGPTRTASNLPDILFDTWYEAIESGTKATLMLMPDKDWTDPRTARAEQAKYLHQMGEAKREARKTNDQTELRIAPREFI